MTEKTPKKTAHHHGDLRNALIQAGIALLEDGGIDALTLRKCAAKAGVSHAAPAHHFDGLSGLKTAIAEEGFRIFTQYLHDAVEGGVQTPQERLKSICRGYLLFGLNHQGLLNVIFGVKGLASLVENFGKEEAHAYLILREVCAPFVPDGMDRQVIEAQVWSLVHGFTLLYCAGEFGPADTDLSQGPFDAVMSLLDRVGTLEKA